MIPSGIITLLTDFGTTDAFVGIMKGVILGISPTARIVDLSHGVAPQQVLPGALLLRSAVSFFPPGTVHVAVVDPGVGSARRPIVVVTESTFLIGPDNGVLFPAAALLGQRAAYVIEAHVFLQYPLSNTFHGRDVFAAVAAHLTRGVAVEQCGPPLDAITPLALPTAHRGGSMCTGEVLYVDHFGNLVTNIDTAVLENMGIRFPAPAVSVTIRGTHVTGIVTAYAAVPEGTPLAIVGSWGMLEIAVRNGSAATQLAAGPGTPVTVAAVELRNA